MVAEARAGSLPVPFQQQQQQVRQYQRRSLSLLLLLSSSSLLVSLVLLYNVPLRFRQAAQVRTIAYPVTDPLLLRMAEQDLSVWEQQQHQQQQEHQQQEEDYRSMLKRKSKSRRSSSTRSSTRPRPSFVLPASPNDLYKINRYLSVVHISTKKGISFLNKLEHVRMLWFGCSLHRILQFLRSKQIDIDTYIVLNVGDQWVEHPPFPIFSKGRINNNNMNNNTNTHGGGGGRDNIMIPYEELLWNYRPLLTTPIHTKRRQVVFRGGCTHPQRLPMVQTIRRTFNNNNNNNNSSNVPLLLLLAADVAVSCDPHYPYTLLSPQQQADARCLLDYDGQSYSRRTAWYLETGSVILRGGVVDDVLSRLARQQYTTTTNNINNDSWTSSSSSPPPPAMVFWNDIDEELIPLVAKCLDVDDDNDNDNDQWSAHISQAANQFWSRYVQHGQSVWDGYLAHLIVEQSKRWSLVVPTTPVSTTTTTTPAHKGYTTSEHHYQQDYSFFSTLSSTLVCPLIQEGAIPTGELGQLQWDFILSAVVLSLLVWAMTHYYLIVPLMAGSNHNNNNKNNMMLLLLLMGKTKWTHHYLCVSSFMRSLFVQQQQQQQQQQPRGFFFFFFAHSSNNNKKKPSSLRRDE